jgi:tetratricopeptide (TPR) repeat protein
MISDLTDKKVLIVDDIPMMRSSIKAMMSALGAKEVDMSPTASDALRRIAAKPYDIILCDFYLGEGKNGQQILEESKSLGLLKASTIFIMITAEKARHQVIGVLEYHPDAYLIKPFNKDTLEYHLEKIIDRKRNIKDINRAIDNKDLNLAIKLCDKKIRENPQNAMEYFRLKSSLFLDTEQYEEARQIFETFLSKTDILWAKIGLGKAYYYTQDYLRAKNIFHEVIEEHSDQVEVYDWLVKTLLAMGNPVEAQRVLELATRISPNVVTRKRTLAELALKNEDIDLAAQSFKDIIQLSKDSLYKNLTDYLNLTQALIRQGRGKESLVVLKNARSMFKSDPESLLRIAVSHTQAFSKMGNDSEANHSLAEARKNYEMLLGKTAFEAALELIHACLLMNDHEYAKIVATTLTRKYHDHDDLLEQMSELFARFNQKDAFDSIANATKDYITSLNRRGVELFELNQHEEAIALFEQASAEQPENVTIALNAAQAIIIYMHQHGASHDMLFRARTYLERAAKGSGTDDRHARLMEMFKELKT